MPLNRIRFADDSNGTGAYTLAFNPSSIDWPPGDKRKEIEMIDSEQATQRAYWDNRPVTLTWNNYSARKVAFASQLAVLRGYKGLKKYINLGDLAGLVPAESAQWIGPFRIVDVVPKIKEGAAVVWESIELIMVRTRP